MKAMNSLSKKPNAGMGMFRPIYPDALDVSGFVTKHGINDFYQSVESRKACCYVRKVLPLNRALENQSAWITGLRREQSAFRSDLPSFEND